MKLDELDVEIKLDENMNNDYEESREILDEGFNPEYPIVIDEDGWILDGNHRYKLFKEAGREDELEFLMIDYNKWDKLVNEEIDKGNIERFNKDDEYFYQRVKEGIKNVKN